MGTYWSLQENVPNNAPDIGFAFCHNLKEKVMQKSASFLQNLVKNDFKLKNFRKAELGRIQSRTRKLLEKLGLKFQKKFF